MNFTDILPSKPLQPAPEHVAGNEIEMGQALVNQNLGFNLPRGVSPSGRRAVSIQQHEPAALQTVHMPDKCAEYVARQITYWGGITRCALGLNHP